MGDLTESPCVREPLLLYVISSHPSQHAKHQALLTGPKTYSTHNEVASTSDHVSTPHLFCSLFLTHQLPPSKRLHHGYVSRSG